MKSNFEKNSEKRDCHKEKDITASSGARCKLGEYARKCDCFLCSVIPDQLLLLTAGGDVVLDKTAHLSFCLQMNDYCYPKTREGME